MSDSSADVTFPAVGGQAVTGRFDAGAVTSDAGLLLLAQADRKMGLTEKLSEQILDRGEPGKVTHPMQDLLCGSASIPSPRAAAKRRETPTIWTRSSAIQRFFSAAASVWMNLCSQPTLSRLENSVDHKDLLCLALTLAQVLIGQLPNKTRSVILDVLDELRARGTTVMLATHQLDVDANDVVYLSEGERVAQIDESRSAHVEASWSSS